MKVALVCIAKDEDNYIKEWVEYYLKLGFDDIFMYQNNYRCSYNNEKLIKIDFDVNHNHRQPDAYNNFMKTNHGKYDFAAFFDVDEFLVLKKHNNIKEFLQEYSQFSAIGINWVLFGDNGLTEVENNEYSCLKRFTKRQKGVNPHVKCIVKVDKNITMSVHHPYVNCVSTDKKLFNGTLNPNGNDDIAQLNHYFVKTKEEFNLKIKKGRCCNTELYQSLYGSHNFNDIEDLHAYNLLYN